jgi:hypothetical protein
VAEKNGGHSTHFVTKGEHGKGQCHHKRHGKDYHVHIAIISHIGQLQQFCYIYVTLLWPILNNTAGDVPGNCAIATFNPVGAGYFAALVVLRNVTGLFPSRL